MQVYWERKVITKIQRWHKKWLKRKNKTYHSRFRRQTMRIQRRELWGLASKSQMTQPVRVSLINKIISPKVLLISWLQAHRPNIPTINNRYKKALIIESANKSTCYRVPQVMAATSITKIIITRLQPKPHLYRPQGARKRNEVPGYSWTSIISKARLSFTINTPQEAVLPARLVLGAIAVENTKI